MSNDNQHILAIKTDQPEAYIALTDKSGALSEYAWEAIRTLSDELHSKINDLLEANDVSWRDLSGIVVYKGPGSFTGLRIGVTVATTLAYALDIPVVGVNGDRWAAEGQELILKNPESRHVEIEYGQDANITKPRK